MNALLPIIACLWVWPSSIPATSKHICQMQVLVPHPKLVYVIQNVSDSTDISNETDENQKQVAHHQIGKWENQTKLEWELLTACCDGYTGPIENCTAQCDNCNGMHTYCAAPGQCLCKVGYYRNAINEDCIPNCTSCGQNTHCLEPEKCICNEGYFWPTKGSVDCLPHCEPKCQPHSKCIGKKLCQCEKGYRLDANGILCQPVCKMGCGNHSKCVAPDQCACDTGYTRYDSSSECTLNCISCGQNTHCLEPEKCICNEGFHRSTPASIDCEPICDIICPANSYCAKPNICNCKAGFNYNASSGNCEPMCQPECINAQCTAPQQCTCLEGYEANTINGSCKPICRGCELGDCLAPGNCKCWQGYRQTVSQKASICEPLPKTPSDCARSCPCWHDETSEEQCDDICSDGVPQPCLDLLNCECIELGPILICPATASRYECLRLHPRMRLKQVPFVSEQNITAKTSEENSNSGNKRTGLIVMACLTFGLVMLGIAAIQIYRYLKLRGIIPDVLI